MLESVGKETQAPLHEEVFNILGNSLMRGVFFPGQKLTLRTLASSLGTSMTPIREAVRQLAASGAIQIIPNKHILIPNLTPEKYMEIVEVRKLLEGHAAARASRNIAKAQISEIYHINEKIISNAKKGNFKKAMEHNQRFHFAVYKAADSETLLEAIKTQWLKIGPSLSYYLYKAEPVDISDPMKGFETHFDLIEALKAGDANSALKAMTTILETAATQLFKALKEESNLSIVTLDEIWTKKGGQENG